MSVEQAPKQKNIGFTYGLIGGLIMAVVLLLLYLGGTAVFLGPFAWASSLIVIVIAVLAGVKQKKLNGGYLTFGEALKTVFTVFALTFLVQSLFSYVLMNFIDTSFRDSLTAATLEKTSEFMRRFGATESQIEETLQNASKKDSYSLPNILLGYGIWCIVFFLISLVIAAIIKKSKPAFENSFNQ